MNQKVYNNAKEYFAQTKQDKCFATSDGMLFHVNDKQHYENHRKSSKKEGKLITAADVEAFFKSAKSTTAEGEKNPDAETETAVEKQLSEMTLAELKEAADKKGIAYKSSVTKAALIELLTPNAE